MLSDPQDYPSPVVPQITPPTANNSDLGANLPEAAAANAHKENLQGATPSQDAPPSPPLPPKPITQTPGPRAQRLQELYSHALSHTFRKISFENFSACYPTVTSQAPGTLHSVHRQMIDRLSQLCNNEFSLIMENRNVVAKLNELESLIAEGEKKRVEMDDNGGSPPVAPHTLPPDVILAAHLAPHLAAHQSQLNARIQTLQSRNAALWDEIHGQRAEINSLMESLDDAINDVDGATELLVPIIEPLSKETKDIEIDMRDLASTN